LTAKYNYLDNHYLDNHSVTHMRFYDRENELALLETLDAHRPSFLVLMGRRRVGKTELVRRFLEGRRSVYLYVDGRKGRDVLLAEHASLVRTRLGLPDVVSFPTYRHLFEYLLRDAGDVVVAVDEFQRLEGVDPSIITELQDLLDTVRDGSRALLIASGSSMGMMHKVFLDQGAPLFKRADNMVTLRPFKMGTTFEMMRDIGVGDEMDRLDLHCLFGGMVHYYRAVEKFGVQDLDSALGRLVLSDLAPLRNEVRDVLVEGFGHEHATYFEVLSALASGRSRQSDIADATHVEPSSLPHYLGGLRDVLGLVELQAPVMEDPTRTKKGRYVLRDNYFSFYFRFIYPNSSLYEVGAYDELRRLIDAGWGGHMGVAFERDAVAAMRPWLLTEFRSVGGHWDRKGNEVDLVGIDPRSRSMLLVEVKAKRLDLGEARRTLRALEGKKSVVPYEARDVSLGLVCVAVEGRDELEGEGHRVWELGDLLERRGVRGSGGGSRSGGGRGR